MQVAFKLDAEQVARANQVVDLVEVHIKKTGDDSAATNEVVFCGNLIGYQDNHSNFNKEQLLTLRGNVMEYRGERHPMRQDGAFEVMKHILGPTWKSARWVKYDSTKPWMLWWEIEEEAVLRRGSAFDIAKHPKVLRFPDRFPDHQNCLRAILGNKSLAFIGASFTTEVIKQTRMMAKKIADIPVSKSDKEIEIEISRKARRRLAHIFEVVSPRAQKTEV